MAQAGGKSCRVLTSKRAQASTTAREPSRVATGSRAKAMKVMTSQLRGAALVKSTRQLSGKKMVASRTLNRPVSKPVRCPPQVWRSIQKMKAIDLEEVGRRATSNHDASRDEKCQHGGPVSVYQEPGEVSGLLLGERLQQKAGSGNDRCPARRLHGRPLYGRSCHEGEKTTAAVAFNAISMKGKLFRARRAFRGWRKVIPPASRLPLPRLAMYGIAMHLHAIGQAMMSLKVLTDFFLYLRAGEGLDIRKRSVIAPVKSAGA